MLTMESLSHCIPEEIPVHCYMLEIQPLNTGDKSRKVCQEYNINIGKISLTKHNHYCIVFNAFNVLMLIYTFCN